MQTIPVELVMCIAEFADPVVSAKITMCCKALYFTDTGVTIRTAVRMRAECMRQIRNIHYVINNGLSMRTFHDRQVVHGTFRDGCIHETHIMSRHGEDFHKYKQISLEDYLYHTNSGDHRYVCEITNYGQTTISWLAYCLVNEKN